MRYSLEKDSQLLCICNLTPVVRDNYRIGVPQNCKWETVVNTDDKHFGGTEYLKSGTFKAKSGKVHGRDQFIEINLPPLSVLYLKPE